MALLKDTLIQGSARVTDTLYTNNININNILSTKKLVISSTTAEEHIQFSRTDNINYILFPNNASTGVGIGYAAGTAYCPLIVTKSSVYPGGTTSTISLGSTDKRWNGVYSSTGDFSGTVTADRLSTNVRLDFRRTDGPSYIMLPDNKDLIINNGSSAGTAYADLQIGKTGIINAYAGSLGSSTYPWGSVYNKGYNYHYAHNSQYISTVYANTAQSTVGEFYYDTGHATNISKGQFGLIEWAPKSTADTGTSGHYERYLFPAATAGLTEDKSYNIITTKNLSIITTVGTISSGTWNGSKIGVAYGGTGATTFTSDCVVVGNGTNAMESRGLKVTGAAGADITLSPDTAGKTMTISSTTGTMTISTTTGAMTIGSTGGNANTTITSGGTLLLNRASGASIIFQQNNTEIARFNQKNSFLIGDSASNQDTYKLYVNGNIGTTGKIAFNTNITTEKASIQYIDSGLFKRGTVFTASSSTAAGGNGTNGYTGARWVFNLGITTLSDGDTITIKVPVASHDYGTYISVDNGTTFKPISVLGSTTRLAGQYGVNSILTLTYDSDGQTNSVFPTGVGTDTASTSRKNVTGGCWRVVNYYDSGNDGLWYARYYSFKAQTAITGVHVVGGTTNGYNNVDSGTPFDIRYPVMYASGNIAAGSANNYGYIFHYAVSIKNSSETNVTFTSYRPIYIKGTISGTTFTPIPGGNPYVDTIAETDDGYVYYYIGRSYGASSMTFDATARKIYWYKNGIVCDYTGLNNVSNNSSLNNISGSIGDIIYWSAANTPARLAKGTAGKFLKMGNNNVPIWGDGSEVTLNGTATTTPGFYAPADSGTVNYLLKSGGPNAAPVWDTHASIDSAGMLHILSVKAHDGFWVNDTYFKGDGTQHIKEALVCVDADNMNQGEVLYEYNASTSTSRFGLYTYANIYNDTSVNTYLTLGISTDGTVKRTYTDAQIYGAVWNDYAEYRKQFYEIEPGRVVRDLNSGHVVLTEERLIPGAQVVSDTFGFAIGETKECQTPLAVSGRVLVFTTQDRYKYNAGDAVCSGPHGTVDIMTREEIQKYPDAIVGIVSEIPTYDTWGQNEVPVQGRIWIKVR